MCVNYREQMECLYDRRREAGAADTQWMEYREPIKQDGNRVDSATLEELIRMLEHAGFAKESISEEDFNIAKQRLDELLQRVAKQ